MLPRMSELIVAEESIATTRRICWSLLLWALHLDEPKNQNLLDSNHDDYLVIILTLKLLLSVRIFTSNLSSN